MPPLVWWPSTTSRSGSSNGSAFTHHAVHDAEDGGVGADRQRHRGDADGGEAGAAPQEPGRIAEVLGQRGEHGGPPGSGRRGQQTVVDGPPRRRAAMFEPGEADERDELTRGHRGDAAARPGGAAPPAPARRTPPPSGRRAACAVRDGSRPSAARWRRTARWRMVMPSAASGASAAPSSPPARGGRLRAGRRRGRPAGCRSSGGAGRRRRGATVRRALRSSPASSSRLMAA